MFDYAVSSAGKFDDVAAWKLGANFNLPLRSVYINPLPPGAQQQARSFFSVNQPHVQIVAVKTLSDSVVRGEVSATPLDPQQNRVFIVRLQEFAGRGAADVQINLPVRIKSAALVNLTEDKTLQNLTQLAPLTVSIKPFETKTVRFEIE